VFSLNICYIFPCHALEQFKEVFYTYECLAYIYFTLMTYEGIFLYIHMGGRICEEGGAH
jgi:hypothetical protein